MSPQPLRGRGEIGDTVVTVDTADTADIVHTVDTLDNVKSVNSVDNVSNVNNPYLYPFLGIPHIFLMFFAALGRFRRFFYCFLSIENHHLY